MDEAQQEELRKIERERRIHWEARKFGVRGLAQRMFSIIMTLIGLMIVLIKPAYAEDYFRIFTLAMGTYIVVFSARIVQINFRIARFTQGEMGLLPLHIRAIAISYIMYCISLHIWILSRFGTPSVFWYGIPFIVIGDLIGIFALGVIWRFQEVRRKAARL
jgi:hypothetical protein